MCRVRDIVGQEMFQELLDEVTKRLDEQNGKLTDMTVAAIMRTQGLTELNIPADIADDVSDDVALDNIKVHLIPNQDLSITIGVERVAYNKPNTTLDDILKMFGA